MDLRPCRSLVVDLLALFNCEHLLDSSLPDEKIWRLIDKMMISEFYMSKSQFRKYRENLEMFINNKKWGGFLEHLIHRHKKLKFDEESRKWAEKVWKGGFHKDEYIELYAGIRWRFKNCFADCALLCIAEESEDKFEDLRNELKKELKLEYECISDKKVLLRKS
jgi:hypothetical protein